MITISQPYLNGNELKYVREAVDSAWISSQGKFVTEFEENFAGYCGISYGVATCNGTTALHLALVALGIGKGDEVLVPDLTFAASANAVIHAGATPVLVDSMSDHWNMDVEMLKRAITPKTKAIMPVHLLGHPCKMEEIKSIADKNSCFIVEDAAEAHGAAIDGKKVGGFGDIGCFSFYANKVLTTGEGGICITGNENLYERMVTLRDHGMDRKKKYWHDIVGFNYRLTNLSAAIGVAQLEQVEYILEARKNLRLLYDEVLSGIRALTIVRCVNGEPVDWLYPIFLNEGETGIDRDRVIKKLKEADIESRPFFYPLHMMPPYKKHIGNNDFPNSRKFALNGILLPLYPTLKAESIRYIGATFRKIFQN